MDIYSIIMLIGGLAFFLFGMNVMSSGLEKVAGGQMQEVLKKLTSNPIKSLLLGAVITIAIQSSSALTVMLVGLVNSGIMEFAQTIHVIMGSDIGTTLTAWILSLSGIESDNVLISMLKPQNFAPIVALIGVMMLMGAKSQKKKDMGTIFCGFAVLMYGMTMMSKSVSPLAEMPQFQQFLIAFDNPFISLLIGTAFTGIIQSSAASIGVLQALALTGQISFGMAIPIIMGANIGTCVTALLSAIGVSKKAKRVPAVHIIIKILGVVIWMVVYLVARYIIRMPLFGNTINAFEIAVFHTIFNIGTIIVLLPFSKQIVRMIEKMLPVHDEEKENEKVVLLDERLLLSPGLAVRQCRERTVEMAQLARDSFNLTWTLFENYDSSLTEQIIGMEERLDYLEDELDTFLIKLSQQALTDSDTNAVSEMMHCINDFERIGDHAINMTKTAKEKNRLGEKFSKQARVELEILRNALTEILDNTVLAFDRDDEETAGLIEPLEQVIDDLAKEIKNRHIERLQTGECSGQLGIILTDLLTNCERVSDHCSNVGVSIIQTRNSTYETHGYLSELKNGVEPDFVEEFEEYHAKYLLPVHEPKKAKGKKAALKEAYGDKSKKNSGDKKSKDKKSDKKSDKK